ncbi:MAG: MFS transporter [Acidimicrobiales bacterium]
MFSPILGRLSDRYGRNPCSSCSLRHGDWQRDHRVGRVGRAPAAGTADRRRIRRESVAQAAVADVAPPEERARLFGLLGAAFGVGFVLGPAIATLASLGGPHLPFFIAAAIAATNAVVALRRLPETHPRLADAVTPMEATGDHLLVAGLEPDAHPVGGLTAGMTPPMLRLVTVAFLALVAFSGFEATFSLLVKDRLDLSLSSTGAVFTVIGLALVLVQVGLIHAATVRLGENGTLRTGLAANLAGLLLLAVDGGWATLVPALALLVVGQGLVTPTMSSALAGRAKPEQRGRVLGFQQSAGSLARVAGPALAGLLYERPGEPAPYLVAGALLAGALALVPGARGWQVTP